LVDLGFILEITHYITHNYICRSVIPILEITHLKVSRICEYWYQNPCCI